MLNLVCHLSGIATTTAAWVDAVAGTEAQIRDTRKTLPGLRALQKYAVRVGGGVNHRMGLGDAALIKDNHVAAAGSVVAALREVRAAAPDLPCEVEVDSLEQLDEVLAEGVELVLLDNFPVWQTQIAVQRRDCAVPGHQAGILGGSVPGQRGGVRGHRRGLPGGRRAHALGAGARSRVGSVGVNRPVAATRSALHHLRGRGPCLWASPRSRCFGRPARPDYTDAQRSDAKAATCAAFDTVRTGVATNTNVTAPGGPDDIAGALAVAANARVALYDGGQYLLARLDPATPADLAAEIRTFGNQLMDIGAAATAGVPNTDPAQAGPARGGGGRRAPPSPGSVSRSQAAAGPRRRSASTTAAAANRPENARLSTVCCRGVRSHVSRRTARPV